MLTWTGQPCPGKGGWFYLRAAGSRPKAPCLGHLPRLCLSRAGLPASGNHALTWKVEITRPTSQGHRDHTAPWSWRSVSAQAMPSLREHPESASCRPSKDHPRSHLREGRSSDSQSTLVPNAAIPRPWQAGALGLAFAQVAPSGMPPLFSDTPRRALSPPQNPSHTTVWPEGSCMSDMPGVLTLPGPQGNVGIVNTVGHLGLKLQHGGLQPLPPQSPRLGPCH